LIDLNKNGSNCHKYKKDELLVALRDPHPCDINMGTIRKAPIFREQIFGIAKYVIQ